VAWPAGESELASASAVVLANQIQNRGGQAAATRRLVLVAITPFNWFGGTPAVDLATTVGALQA